MQLLPPGLAYLRDAHRRGDRATVLALGDRIAAELTEADRPVEAAEAVLLVGLVRAAGDEPATAVAWLEHALGALAPTDRALVPAADAAELVLLDLELRLGRYADVAARLQPLLEPERPIETRFGATRAHAALATLRGDHQLAHQLLNTAGGLAERMRSRFRHALVEGDRAILLAAQARLFEAAGTADRVLASLIRPAMGPMQQWADTQAATVAAALARAGAVNGDTLTAQRFLIAGTRAAQRAGGSWLAAQLDLATGALATAEGEYGRAEPALLDARATFTRLGAEPSVALAILEQGRLALARGLYATAQPLLAHATSELARLGHAVDAREARGLLAHVPAPTETEPAPGGN